MINQDNLPSLKLAHESLKNRTDISWEEFLKHADGWEVIPVKSGAVLRKGAELHACINPDGFGKWFNKAMFALLDDTIKKHGYAVTRVTEGNSTGDTFVRRLGFVLEKTKDGVWVYRKV